MECQVADSEGHASGYDAVWYTDCGAPNDKKSSSRPFEFAQDKTARHMVCRYLLAKVKSKLVNTCANVFTRGKFTRVVPMTSRVDAGKSLVEFTDDVGIPENLVTDGAAEFMVRTLNL